MIAKEERGADALLLEDVSRLVSRLRIMIMRASIPSRMHPVLRAPTITLRGPPLDDGRFRPLPSAECSGLRVCAVDASVRPALDLGAIRAYLVKVVGERYVGLEGSEPLVRLRLICAGRLEEALSEMCALECALAEELIERERPDLLLMDRGLSPRLKASPLARAALERLLDKAEEAGVTLVGISKSSTLQLDDGTPLAGYLFLRARRLGLDRWVYHPLFDPEPGVSLAVACFSAESGLAFRIDVYPPKSGDDLVGVLAKVAALQDPALPGYPYPLLRAHRDCLVRMSEVEAVRGMIQDALEHDEVLRDVIGFRRRELEGRRGDLG